MTIQTEEILETAHEISEQLIPFHIGGHKAVLELTEQQVKDLFHIVSEYIVRNESDLPESVRKSLGEVA